MKKNSLKTRIAESFRRKINAGILRPQDPIPPTCRIAEEFGTAPSNVHRALLSLVREGLIVRKPGHGSVVAPNLRKLRDVAVCVSVSNPFDGYRFRTPLAGYVCDELKKRGMNPVLQFYQGKGQLLEHLNGMTESGSVQGAVLIINIDMVCEIRDKLTIPYAIFNSAEVDYGAKFDFRKALDEALAALKMQGCRTLALIGTAPSEEWKKTASRTESKRYVPLHTVMQKTAKIYGLELPEEFIQITGYHRQTEEDRSQFGWTAANRLFAGRKRPDALVVSADDLLPGIIYALKEKNIRVPEELQLIPFFTRELSFFSPYPLAKIEVSLARTAVELCNILERASRGEKVSCRKMDFSFCGLPEIKKA